MSGSVVAVSSSNAHTFSKSNRSSIELVQGMGVVGDAHFGSVVKHRYLVRRDATQPNLRQVHLIHEELLSDFRHAGHVVTPGQLGENVTTSGVDLLSLPTGTVLRLGADAVVELTGLRNPCSQIDDFQVGLMKRLRYRDANGATVRLAGVMSVVLTGGVVNPGDSIAIELPEGEPQPLDYIVDSHRPVPACSYNGFSAGVDEDVPRGPVERGLEVNPAK